MHATNLTLLSGFLRTRPAEDRVLITSLYWDIIRGQQTNAEALVSRLAALLIAKPRSPPEYAGCERETGKVLEALRQACWTQSVLDAQGYAKQLQGGAISRAGGKQAAKTTS